MFGIWLFANSAAYGMYRVLCRMGLSVSYTTVLRSLRILSKHSTRDVYDIANTSNFIVVYDNINRTRYMYSTESPDRSKLLSGTASTLYLIEDGDLAAVNPAVVRSARQSRSREGMTPQYLLEAATKHEEQLINLMALHVLSFLLQSDASFNQHQPLLRTKLEAAKVECMRQGRRTVVHPLSTTDDDEGTVTGNRDVLDDIFLRQLNLDKNVIEEHVYLVGGDLATIERIRKLQSLLLDCPHGYARYDWVLPLVQLWHMGWADLARIIATHWGKDNREGFTLQAMNVSLGRNVKKVLRPDYYPAQKLVFDTLYGEVIDCFRCVV